jgi:hypothetical protein
MENKLKIKNISMTNTELQQNSPENPTSKKAWKKPVLLTGKDFGFMGIFKMQDSYTGPYETPS